jgi:hypothetical protein
MKKILLIAFLVLAPCLLCGCFASFNTLYAPSVGITQSILPEYDEYVNGDITLTPADKTIRLNDSKMFRKLVEEYGK